MTEVADSQRTKIGRSSIGRSRVWWEGLRIGAHTFVTAPVLGFKRLVLPVSYWRIAEFTYAWNQLQLAPGSRVLDVGSPKDLAFMLARNHDVNVVATDILPPTVRLSKRYTDAQGLTGFGLGRVHSEVQDGRSVAYADDTFDAAFSVSVLEHIPNDGDAATIKELVRVVKPGGRIVITVPFSEEYKEDWVNGAVYEREQEDDRTVFYQRHYDGPSLRSRLLKSVDVDVLNLEIWGESRLPAEQWLDKSPFWRLLLSPVEPLLSLFFLHRLDGISTSHAMAAFFTLQA